MPFSVCYERHKTPRVLPVWLRRSWYGLRSRLRRERPELGANRVNDIMLAGDRLTASWRRLQVLFRRDRFEEELDEEMQFHVDMLAADARRNGLGDGEAHRVAAARFGNRRALRERSGDGWSLGRLDAFAQDLRYGARFLRRSPTFTMAAILSITLGVGANAAVFTVVDRVFFRPPTGLANPEALRRIYVRSERPGRPAYTAGSLAYAEFHAIDSLLQRSQLAAVADVGFPRPTRLGTGPDAPKVRVSNVSTDAFEVLGVRPALGRLFMADDDNAAAAAIPIVLAYELWQREFGGSREVLGKRLVLNDRVCVVIGVAQRGFSGIEVDAAEVWLPELAIIAENMGADWRTSRGTTWIPGVVRLSPRTSEMVAAESVRRALMSLPTPTYLEGAVLTVSLGSMIRARGPAEREAGISVAIRLAVAALLVLLAACANVANLLFARALARRRESAVRLAIGVSGPRLMAQMVIEALMLCIVGAAAAVACAQLGGNVLRALVLPDVSWQEAPVDTRVVLFTASCTLVFGLIASAVPGWRASRTDPGHALKTGMGDRGSTGQRLRSGILSLQLALSVILLVGAGLFTRSLVQASRLDLGFDATHTIAIIPSFKREARNHVLLRNLMESAIARLERVQMVRAVGASAAVPFYSISFETLSIPGRDIKEEVRSLEPFLFVMDPDAVRAMGVRLVAGRLLTSTDRAGSPRVTVVSESMARALWPGESALGKCLRIGADTTPCSEVVGVTHDLVSLSLTRDGEAQYFVPFGQLGDGYQPWALLAKVPGDPLDGASQARAALKGWTPELTGIEVRPIRDLMDRQIRPWRLGASVFAIFGLIALLLAAIGVYGIVSFSVTSRTGELGIRAALGATRARLARLVLGQTIRLTLVGLALGAVIAISAGRSVEGLLFKTSPHDPSVVGTALLTLLVTSLVAVLGPTRRASRVDPATALRAE